MPSIAASTPIRGLSDDWITPKWLLDRLGPFELDPCASRTQPWPCAKREYTLAHNGLVAPWNNDYVFLNPPYGAIAAAWLEKLSLHPGGGIALVFARTETKMFFSHVWPYASSVLFLSGRLTFHRPDGAKAAHNSGGPSCLIAYGCRAATALSAASELGALVVVSAYPTS